LKWCHGFAIGSQHIDTQEGLNAFAELLREIRISDKKPAAGEEDGQRDVAAQAN
jgi:hypothetical protein